MGPTTAIPASRKRSHFFNGLLLAEKAPHRSCLRSLVKQEKGAIADDRFGSEFSGSVGAALLAEEASVALVCAAQRHPPQMDVIELPRIRQPVRLLDLF